MTTPQSARAKGRKLERDAAAVFGGKRTPLSGAAGGNDVTLPTASIFGELAIETKARKRMSWTVIDQAFDQARAASKGGNKIPAVVTKEDGGKPMIHLDLAEFVQWSTALAEMGNGYAAKRVLAQIRRGVDELWGLL